MNCPKQTSTNTNGTNTAKVLEVSGTCMDEFAHFQAPAIAPEATLFATL